MDASGTDRVPVTVLIPTLNEEQSIEACLESVSYQTYPRDLLDVIVLDGGSTDATVEMAKRHGDQIPHLRVIDNPKRIQAAALNLGIEMAAHETIVRLDAHTEYEPDYIERSVAALESSGASVVGGPMRPRSGSPFGKAVVDATTSRIGVGPGAFHYPGASGEVDTVYLGTFRRQTVVDAGGYDEAFAVGEDHELNARIRAAGGSVVLDPSIRSWYQPRSTPGALWKQYFRYGQAKVDTFRKHGRFPTWRPLAPAALVAAATLSVFALFTPLRPWIWMLWAAYLVAVLVAGVARYGLRIDRALRFTAAVFIMHWSYGLGLWQRLLRPRA